MTTPQTDTAPTQGHAVNQVLSVDAMGGDQGPATVVAGLSLFLKDKPAARAILHGPKAELDPLVAKHGIGDRVTIHDASDVVKMTDKPIKTPIFGTDILLNDACPKLMTNQPLIVSGEPLQSSLNQPHIVREVAIIHDFEL